MVRKFNTASDLEQSMKREDAKTDCVGRWTNGGETSLRLICFSHAGAGASVYSRWAEKLPQGVEVCAVRYPGRESRLREPPCDRMHALIDVLSQELLPWLDLPFAFFGHSMGALVAFELSRSLRRRHQRGPVRLFVSGRVAPHLVPSREPICHLPDADFLERVRRMGGTPDEAFAQPELLELILPILKADLTVCETYICETEPPLDCPVTALGGTEDPQVSSTDLIAWQDQTSREFSSHLIEGDHFFVRSRYEDVTRIVSANLAPLVSNPDCSWKTAAFVPTLSDTEIHLWATTLHATPAEIQIAESLLSTEERERANRFVYDVHRYRFILRRAWLRRVLSEYAGQNAGTIKLSAGPHGKPELTDSPMAPDLRFNMSHSDGIALLAVTRSGEVGVDIERVRPLDDLSSMLRTCLSANEQRDLARLDDGQRTSEFFRYWTCKEAIVKAHGEGLGIPLESVPIVFRAGADPEFIGPKVSGPKISGPGEEVFRTEQWSLKSFVPFAGFSAAVAAPQPNIHVELLRPPCGVNGWAS